MDTCARRAARPRTRSGDLTPLAARVARGLYCLTKHGKETPWIIRVLPIERRVATRLKVWQLLSVVLFLAVSRLPLVAQDSDFDTQLDRFELYTACARIDLLISVYEESDNDLAGLTEESVRRAVTSRLRSARLLTSDSPSTPYLRVAVSGIGNAFSIRIRLNKPVFDSASGLSFSTPTWLTGTTGTHGRNGQFVRGAVAELMDEFIDEYLRVNEAACSRR